MQDSNLNTSSIIELKAELLKKKQKYEEEKLEYLNKKSKISPSSKPSRTKQNNNLNEPSTISGTSTDRISRKIENEDMKIWEKSRSALEAKARLYEKLEKKNFTDDLNASQREGLLVDFASKGWDHEKQTYNITLDDNTDSSSEEAEVSSIGVIQELNEKPMSKPTILDSLLALPEHRKDDWVEYEDEFGRTRTVKPRELALLLQERKEAEKLIKDHLTSQSNQEYSDVAAAHYKEDWEIRTKGVGYFKFSALEEDRIRQMTELRELRAATVESRTRSLLLREQRRLQVERRLELVRQRRKKLLTEGKKSEI